MTPKSSSKLDDQGFIKLTNENQASKNKVKFSFRCLFHELILKVIIVLLVIVFPEGGEGGGRWSNKKKN